MILFLVQMQKENVLIVYHIWRQVCISNIFLAVKSTLSTTLSFPLQMLSCNGAAEFSSYRMNIMCKNVYYLDFFKYHQNVNTFEVKMLANFKKIINYSVIVLSHFTPLWFLSLVLVTLAPLGKATPTPPPFKRAACGTATSICRIYRCK